MSLQQAWYDVRFENEFLKAKGDEFQSLFERLMGLAYPSDFIACRPWGNRGDRKNDGFLRSERRLCQVYAPYEMTESAARAKINEDFAGALEHWGVHFDKWSFVHNAVQGLPPHIIELMLKLEYDHRGVHLDSWCLNELLGVFRRISPTDLVPWLGNAPSESAITHVAFDDIKLVIDRIEGGGIPDDGDLRQVPPEKLRANALSPNTSYLLSMGIILSPIVDSFFRNWHDETLEGRVADAFRLKYQGLRGTMQPDQIYSAIQEWVSGPGMGTTQHQTAVLGVLAYFFERCDIFERPREITG